MTQSRAVVPSLQLKLNVVAKYVIAFNVAVWQTVKLNPK